MSRLRVGIVGCGEVTQVMHLPALHHLRHRFDVSALADVSRHVAEGVARRWGVPAYHTSADALLEANDVDVVLVATPDVDHAYVVVKAASAGKHVLVEKPLCITHDELDRIIEARDRADVIVQVGYMRRYDPAFRRAVELLSDVGPICLVRVHDVMGRNVLITERTGRPIRDNSVVGDDLSRRREQAFARAIGTTDKDRQTAYHVLLALGTHSMSVMRGLIGMPNHVEHAALRHAGTYITAVFDYGDYICHYATGIDEVPRVDAHIEVFGRDGVLRLTYDTPYVRNLPTRVTTLLPNGRGGTVERVEHPSWGDSFVSEWDALADSVLQNRAVTTPAEEARDDLAIFGDMLRFIGAAGVESRSVPVNMQ